MKKFNKTMAAAIIAGAMSFTSCVDNEVSPDVKQMREAQASYLQAKADLAAAEAASKLIDNEFKAAMNAINLASNEATLRQKNAEVDLRVAQAQASLATAELELAKAIVKLEGEIANAGNEVAATYLADYKTEMLAANALRADKITKDSELAKAKLLLTEMSMFGEQKSFDFLIAQLESELAKRQATLIAQEAALAKLEAISADPSTTGEELNTLYAEIEDLNNKNLALDVALEKADQAEEAAEDVINNAEETVLQYKGLQANLDGEEEIWFHPEEGGSYFASRGVELRIEEQNSEIEELTTTLSEWNTELTRLEANLAVYEAAIAPKTIVFETAQTAYNAAVINTKNALVPYNVAHSDFKFAIKEYYAAYDGNSPAAEYQTTNNVYEAEKDNFEDYKAWYEGLATPTEAQQAEWAEMQERWATWQAAFTPYKNAYETLKVVADAEGVAYTTMYNAELDMRKYINDVNQTEYAIELQEEKIAAFTKGGSYRTTNLFGTWSEVSYANSLSGLEAALVLLNEEKAETEAEITRLQPAYDDAVANMDSYETAYEAAQAAWDALDVEKSANSDMIDNKNDVIAVINTQLAGINQAIASKKTQIASTKEDINVQEAAVANGVVSKATAEAKIVKLEAELEVIVSNLNAHLALAAEYKAMLDAALGN